MKQTDRASWKNLAASDWSRWQVRKYWRWHARHLSLQQKVTRPDPCDDLAKRFGVEIFSSIYLSKLNGFTGFHDIEVRRSYFRDLFWSPHYFLSICLEIFNIYLGYLL